MDEKNKGKGTHVVTTPNKPLTPIDDLKKSMAGDYHKQVLNFFGGREEEALRFMTAAVEHVRRVPKLLECNRTTLLTAFIQLAQFRFLPSTVGGEAFIIPYKNEAKFQLGYQGIITLLWRTQQVKSIKSLIVYDNEKFEYSEGLETRLVHVPTKFGVKKGKPIGVYAVAETTNGGRLFKIMSEEDVLKIKAMSKAKDSPDSPWNSKDPEKWMWQKTCLIQLAKLLPKSAELQQAIEKDYEGSGLEKGRLDPGGPGVGAAFHEPSEAVSPSSDEPSAEEQARILENEKKGL